MASYALPQFRQDAYATLPGGTLTEPRRRHLECLSMTRVLLCAPS